MLSTATSLDALAVGLSLALLGVSVWYPSAWIGLITGGMCVLAIALGNRLRSAVGRWAEVTGGVVLWLIGLKIVVNHL
jgi:putative Mn2+ efflux pump MntP